MKQISEYKSPLHRDTPSISDAVGVFLKQNSSFVSLEDDQVEETGEFYISEEESDGKFVFREDLESSVIEENESFTMSIG